MNSIATPRHHIFRMRREVRRRSLTVAFVAQLTPNMRRIHFTSPDLHDFESLSPDDHVKLFVPTVGNVDRCMRDYTPRAFDPAKGTLTIDFALHEAGPATAWALRAQQGDTVEIGGPRGSLIVPDDFDWYLLIGDETALPSIGRRIEALRRGVPVTTIAIVANEAERQTVQTQAAWTPIWVTRDDQPADDATLLHTALTAVGPLPEGDGYIWIAAEARVAKALKTYVVETLGHPKAWLKAAGYWVAGQPDQHLNLDD